MNYEPTGFDGEFDFEEYLECGVCDWDFQCGIDFPIDYWATWGREENIFDKFDDEDEWDEWEQKCWEDIVRINITGKARVIQKWVRSTKCRAKVGNFIFKIKKKR